MHFIDRVGLDEDGALEPIAICGMACRLPGDVDSASSLWEMLVDKRSGQTPKVPASRFNIDAHFHPNLERPGSFNVMGGYFLDNDPKNFDPTFFSMTPIEAMWLDPQQRKMLEVCYEVLESAGRSLESVAGSNTAVFIGSFTADYQQMSTKDPDFRHNYAATGVDPGIISNRIGNAFNLKGPSFTINTACSSSVYATHMACHALRARDCEAAIVGGVNLILTVDQHMNTAKLGILSPTSTCHTFDESADGYGRAEGAGALYLKRLSDAIRDGDPVRSIIRSSAVNTNGKVPGMGITHPSVTGQERVVRQAYERARLDPNRTAYVECHGTGTPVGDPIEVQAISRAMNETRSLDKPLILGAIKPNIGHSEAASGIFAIMKAALMTETGVIPGVCGLKTINPAIHENEWNVKIYADSVSWPKGFASNRAGVSSFGYGGTNGHVVVEDVHALYPFYIHGMTKNLAPYNHSTSRPLLVCFSAHDKATLTRNIDAHARVASKFYLTDLAHTLNTKRSRFSSRAFTVATEDKAMEAFDLPSFKFGTAGGKKSEPGFIFTGQGAQWARMGAEAILEFPIFREAIQHLDLVIQACPHPPSWSLEKELLASPDQTRLYEAELAQPALTAIQIALVDLFASWGVFPSVTIGHSSGEMGAAYAAGLLSAPEAMLAAYYRGYALAHHAPSGGTMLAIGLGPAEVVGKIPGLGEDPEVACENSPSSVTLSGTVGAIRQTKALLDAEGIFARELRTGQAYHSSHMKGVATPFRGYLEQAYEVLSQEALDWHQPRARMISSVTATEIEEMDINPRYWATNLTSRVRFSEAVAVLANTPGLEDVCVMLEIGPHPALAGPFKQICKVNGLDRFNHIPSLVRASNCSIKLLECAGELFLRDYPVDLEVVNAAQRPRERGFHKAKNIQPFTLVDLPPYQWNYAKTHWTEPRLSHEQRQLTHLRHDILGSRIVGLSDSSLAWRNILRHKDLPWLKDHSLGNSAIFPAAGHLSLAIEAVRQICENKRSQIIGVTLRDIDIKTALVIPENDDGIEIQTRIIETQKPVGTNQWYSFTIESLSDGRWVLHCKGTISPILGSEPSLQRKGDHPVNVSSLTQRVPPKRWYDAFSRVGFDYGPSFQKLGLIKTNNKYHAAAADVTITAEIGNINGESRYILHPATVDACLQLIIISIHAGRHREMPWGVVPTAIEEVSLFFSANKNGTQGSAVAWTDELDGRHFNTNVKLVDSEGKLILDVNSLHCVAYEAAIPQNASKEILREPYAAIAWKPDISTLTSLQAIHAYPDIQSESETITKIVELVDHKQSLTDVLLLGFPSEGAAEAILKGIPAAATVTLMGSSDLVDTKPAPRDLILVAKEVFRESSLETVFSQIKPLLVNSGKLVISVDSDIRDTVAESLVALGFATPTLQFDLPDVTVILSSTQPSINGVPHQKYRVTVAAADIEENTVVDLFSVLSRDCYVELKPLRHYDTSWDTHVIVADFDGRLLEEMDEETFSGMKRLLCSSDPTVWVTVGVHRGTNVPGGMSLGLLRTIRAEQSNAQVTHLDIDSDTSIDALGMAALQKLQTISFLGSGADTEFWLRKGIFHVSRIVPNDELNAQFNFSLEPAQKSSLEPESALRGEIVDGEVVFVPLGPSPLEETQVEMQVDCFFMEGDAPQAFTGTPKLTAGRILNAGKGLPSSLIGQEVLTFCSEVFSSVIQVPEVHCVRFNRLNREALTAALPGLCKAVNAIGLSNLSVRQRIVLVKSPPSIVKIFTQLGHAIGLTVSTVESCEEFHELVSRNVEPLTVVAHEFSGISQEIWRAMPAMGRFVFNECIISDALDPLPFARGVTLGSSTIATLHKRAPKTLSNILRKSLELLEECPSLLIQRPKIIDISEAATTKVASHVVTYGYGHSTIKVRPAASTLRLLPDVSYLLVGCLGGLGRSLTTFMMERGARNFAFISRSGADKPDAKRLVASLVEAGANVQVFRADASNTSDVAKVVSEVSASLPIRGVVHAAMVLQDAMFGPTMTFDTFKAVINPKVGGAQALHSALHGHPLDFFVMTSSVSGTIGNPGQANYSAANSYLDTLAWHRNLNGLPGTSLVLPMVLDVGVVAENGSLESMITRKGWYGIDEREMLGGFETAMLHPVPEAGGTVRLADAQIILGVEPQFFASAIMMAPNTADIYWLNDTRFSRVRRAIDTAIAVSGSTRTGTDNSDIVSLVACAFQQEGGGPDAAVRIVADHIMKKCSSILLVPLEDLEFDSGSVASHGLDSMIGVELRNWLFKEFSLEISFQNLLSATLTFKGLSAMVCQSLLEGA